MIHVCFSLHDKSGAYSKFTGTAMLSIFENCNLPTPSTCVHLLHDNTLTEDNRDKFIQIANRYGQQLKFYNMEELCADKLAKLKEYFPYNDKPKFSIAMFYRLFIPQLLSQDIEKVIYLDADLIINLDITELWQVELKERPLAVVPEVYNGGRPKYVSDVCRNGLVEEEDYFNSGVMLMNLNVLRKEEATLQAGIKFRSEHPEYHLYDQEIFNYCFATRALKLPARFNRSVKHARLDGELTAEKKICHYTNSLSTLGLDMSDPFNHLWMSYFIKTPWFKADTSMTGNHLPSQKNHSVSVIIPLFNAEKYIGEALDSLLAQTLQDFEVIIVDDCSTDSSCEIVESYMPKFGGRLKLYHLKENSGSGGVPRNKGILFSSGEYIQFLDADDTLTKTALEEMYTLAKDSGAEVVYCERHYQTEADGTDMQISILQPKPLVRKPTFETEDFAERVDKILKSLFVVSTCFKFVQRELLIKNEIFFPHIVPSEDDIWTYGLVFYAKKFLRVPNAVYVRRLSENSVMRTERTPQQAINFWLNPVFLGLKALDDLMSKHKFFSAEPSKRYALLQRFIYGKFYLSSDFARELPEDEVYATIKDNFGDKFGEHDVLIPALCTELYKEKVALANERKAHSEDAKLLRILKPYVTARIDIKLMTKSDFQIFNISDDKVEITKPQWLQKNGSGCVLHSCSGSLEFVLKTTADGQINLSLRGMEVYFPEDKTKRIPYWIDYTKLIVNGKTIFDEITPAWHDKTYRYTMKAKADEEITVQVEWQPHRSDNIESKAATPKVNMPEPKVETPKITAPEPKVVNLQPTKIESSIPRKFNPLTTARIDVRFVSTMGDFQILSISDDKAKITKPDWFQRNGIGYIVQSSHGKLTFIAKVTADGQINLNLRGMDIRNPDDWTKGIAKRIPYWIDYTKLTVNEKNIFSTRTPAWCDEPYKYVMDVKANEEIVVVIEWQPHNDT